MRLKILHRTVYRYEFDSRESQNEVRLEPVSDGTQACLGFEIRIDPYAKVFRYLESGGSVHSFTLRSPHQHLAIDAESQVETRCSNPFDGLNLIEPDMHFYELLTTHQQYVEFLTPSKFVEETDDAKELATRCIAASGGIASQFLLTLNRTLYDQFTYDPGVTDVHSKVREVFQLQAGVCQDFAHAMIACCRSVGVPARYVSGYLHSTRGSGIRGNQAMHAWVECPLPDGRWLSLDPTNNLLANDHHVRVHTGRDYGDITPLRGVYTGSSQRTLEVEIRVSEIADLQNIA